MAKTNQTKKRRKQSDDDDLGYRELTHQQVLESIEKKRRNNKSLNVTDKLALIIDDITTFKSKNNGVRHSPEMKAMALTLYSMGYSYERIGDALKIGSSTARAWINDVNALDPSNVPLNELVDGIKSNLRSKLYLLTNRVLSAVSDEDLEKASLVQKFTSAGIAIDKARLLDGESTHNVSTVNTHVVKLDDQSRESDDELLELEADIARIESAIESIDD